ncbi:MAG: S9 family peptidase [Synergistaceae bacterium]|jgi:dipeptidyl aminopeptidase/acylaminoacyl peptidase|nr:S9 family peptidase [Synergistaceae bacterium]
MQNEILSILALTFGVLAAAGKGTASAAIQAESVPQLIPVEDFFRNSSVVGFSLSPDGTKLASLKPWKNRMNVFVRDVEGKSEERRLTSATERDIGGFFWKGNDRIAYVQDRGGDENFHVFLVDVSGGEPRELTPFDGVKTYVLDDLEEDPHHMLISMNKNNPEVFDVYRCDMDTGELTQVAENPGNITGWMTDHEGRLRGACETDGVNQSLLYRATEDEPFKKLMTTSFKDDFAPLMFSYDNRLLYVASNLNRDRTAIYTFDPEANKTLDLVYEHPEVDVGRLLSSKKRKVITGAVYVTDRSHYHFFDEERRALQETLEAKFPGYEVAVTNMDDEERRVVLATFSDRSRGTYYLYDRQTEKLEKLAEVAPWLKEDQMASMLPIRYTSRDGLTINGYLTLPRGMEVPGEEALRHGEIPFEAALNLPVVVIPHGGPSARDTWGYDSEAQFLANRGAAVLQVNFRGSVGYGKGFWEAGFKQWGRGMQNDVTDGVEWLIARGIADRNRVAIYGGSYGGYAALAGAAFTPDLYACAVSYVGPSNIFTLLASIPPYWEPLRDMEYEMIGDPEKDKELLEQVSPVFHADQIRIPLFVAQGANDPRVKKAESDQIVEAVKKAGKDVVYMVKENEGHGFHNEENRIDFYRTMEDFFRRHLKTR